MEPKLYRNHLKNREFDKKAPQNLYAEQAAIAERQDASEHPNFEVKPTPSKTDSSGGFGIEMTRKFRTLTFLLMASGSLNIGLIVYGVISRFQEDKQTMTAGSFAKMESSEEVAMQPFFMQLVNRSFHELVAYLTNREPVGEGYFKRDMAVSALVAFHHFNLEKAIGGAFLQKRKVSFNGGPKIEIFPGLTEDQFDAIIRFAYEERWPLTAEGLFKLLKRSKGSQEASLVQAFLLTSEFHALQVLFQRVDGFQDTSSLIQLVCEGSWDLLHQFTEEQSELLDLSVEKRRSLLLSYLHQKSQMAAHLLLQLDFAFALKRLDDSILLELLSLCKEKTKEAEKLCLELLKAPRTDAVWTKAAQCLYAYVKEDLPSPWNLQVALERFKVIPSVTLTSTVEPIVSIEMKTHVVKEGDSLWKIARQYNVKVDQIVKLNGLEKDHLRPGMTIQIP